MIETEEVVIHCHEKLGIQGQNSYREPLQQKDKLNREYATYADFCHAFARDTKHLYLLAFLLTANHLEAERCFAGTLEESSLAAVFKDRISSWIKRSLIKVAIQNTLQEPGRDRQVPDQWWGGQTDAIDLIDAVARLSIFERFVFVMSVLERYSMKECSLLLHCPERTVIKAKKQALRELPLLQRSISSLFRREM